jgi:ectoine hydroxylase-related dioxygenase (phytanoyl-CoA dioxygenase family)
MTQQLSVEAAPRAVSDEEVAHYREHGWAKLEGFLSSELAAGLLAAAKAVIEPQLEAQPEEEEAAFGKGLRLEKLGGKVANLGYWQDLHYIGRDEGVEPFATLIYSEAIGRAAQRFVARNVGIRYSADIVACKMPAGQAGGAPTDSHQDISSLPFDRVGPLTFWIALDDMPPERGTMRFLSGSQRAGNLGRVRAQGKGTVEYYPELLDEYETSPPMALRAGDATVHNAQVVHWAPENSTARPRWGYIVAYFPETASTPARRTTTSTASASS